MLLSSYLHGRDNNLNLIRIIAALAVLAGHGFALLGQSEPWGELTGMTPGSIAVDVFFILSGLLVTASLVSRKNPLEYICARGLRIFPALVVMLVLTVFVLGMYFTSLPVTTYLSAPQTSTYFFRCASLLDDVAYTLPGVFVHNPYPHAVNGSLWTLTHEVKMYILLLVFWCGIDRLFALESRRVRAFRFLIMSVAVLAGILFFTRHFLVGEVNQFAKLPFLFFSGASAYLFKEKLFLSSRFFYALLGLMVVSVILGKQVFFIVYFLGIAYLAIYLAYAPAGVVRKYNGVGDYSYGVYIYAFPVQQSIAALFPGMAVFAMIMLSGVFTLMLAVLSWHLIEKPALAVKEAAVISMRHLTGRFSLV
ncbi:acyltransferase family protein [Undibacterium sp. TJN19]|uniref:acyltransferase family protein n=1 Tax=Undibacterium sp. TJN19 TaxID=3413055 RepID=UPI003BF1B7C7